MEIQERLSSLRELLKNSNLQAAIIPSNDPHQSEYVSDLWKLREYFSGFTGSAGTLVVTENEAALWTDSRYFLQVEQECADSEVELHKQSIPHAPEHIDWLCETLDENSSIGIDFRLFSPTQVEHIIGIASSKKIELVDLKNELVQLRDFKENKIELAFIHDELYAGKSVSSKLTDLRGHMKAIGAEQMVLTKLDEIAWLLNFRGGDISYTPYAMCYCTLDHSNCQLFISSEKVTVEFKESMEKQGVMIMDYLDITNSLEQSKLPTALDGNTVNYAVFNAVSNPIFTTSPIIDWKSVKNETERHNIARAMVRDGRALCRFFIWLEDYLQTHTLTEFEAGERLESFRKMEDLYKYPSFGTICGYQENGAIIHYRAPEQGSKTIKNEGILLLDSGAQYLDATTDITRTIWLGGTIPDKIKKAYTAILKGLIGLEISHVPKGTTGMQLDTIARKALWNQGLNYGHGTGHGVGCFGMVHEAPQGFATSNTTSRGSAGHQLHQLTSIEPGCYVENEFGIRIENLVFSIQSEQNPDFLTFKSVTLCPIDTQLLDKNEMTKKEIDWLNTYHTDVFNQLSPTLNETEKAWLKEKCKAI